MHRTIRLMTGNLRLNVRGIIEVEPQPFDDLKDTQVTGFGAKADVSTRLNEPPLSGRFDPLATMPRKGQHSAISCRWSRRISPRPDKSFSFPMKNWPQHATNSSKDKYADGMTADFEHLVRSNSGRIRRIAMRYADPGETEDMVQEILLALWRSLSRCGSIESNRNISSALSTRLAYQDEINNEIRRTAK
jgi:hypothetical protein